MKRATLLFLFFSALPALALDHVHFLELNKQASAFAKQQDWKSLRASLIEIGREMPAATPTYMLRMASVETHLGNRAEALRWMERYAATGLTYDVTQDDDLKPLAGDKDYQPIAARMQAQARPVANAELVCTLPMADLMPEDLTYVESSQTFVVSSIQHHALYRVRLPKDAGADCRLEEIPLAEHLRLWPVVAVSADSQRNLLWATIAAFPGFSGIAKEEQGKTALVALNPDSGKVTKRFDLDAGEPAVFGDMSVGKDGTVFVTDSLGGGVYRVRGPLETAKLEKIAGGLFSPQTPVLAADGRRLFVADYSIGIAVIDLATGRVEYLPHPDNLAVTGLDGLHLAGNSLIGVQNGTDPERVIRLRLNPAQTAIAALEIVEQATPRLGEPTHAIEVSGFIYLTGNVGWGKIGDDGKVKPGEQFTKPVLLRFKP
ncbi:MAG TPA: hypothetical protein VKB77_07350 [Terriglobales bacterium]|nr:hypothetical protein [Terriglobales bacterium]